MLVEITDIPTQVETAPELPKTEESKFDYVGLLLQLLFWLLKPFLAVGRLVLTLTLWVRIRFLLDKKISHTAKCPGCGVRKWHTFAFSQEYSMILHTCLECRAVWANAPIVAAEKWQVKESLTIEQIKDILG